MDTISAETVTNLMKSRDIHSYAELCRRAGISRPSLYALMSNESPYRETVIKLAAALGVKPSQLINSEES
ncbi:helix-turn-helix domain-containing protein [Trueperella pyogenes]|uniref:helix-turn-helix domain-containing protein n=1 Tax=Trueperella pyogenes TaxID=1661 RepID=UPI0014331C7A|nr:helix-turn-helix transcriptional regulator [Trueperella pyogenes]